MPEGNNTFNIGSVGGGQNNFGGRHNTFNQQVNGPDAAQIATLLGRVRDDLAAFPDPEAAGRMLTEIQAAAPAEFARPGRIRTLLHELSQYAGTGTEALTALTALIVAVQGATG